MIAFRAARIFGSILAIALLVAPAKAQSVLQQIQAKAMREALPREARCEWLKTGTPVCSLNGPGGDSIQITGLNEDDSTITSGRVTLVSASGGDKGAAERDYLKSAQSIFTKYLSALSLDSATVAECLRNAATAKGSAESSVGTYLLQCELSDDTFGFSVVVNNKF